MSDAGSATVVIVNFKTSDMVADLAEQLADYRMVIVDNYSSDGERRRISELSNERIEVIFNRNDGFAAGVNLGLASVPENHHALLLNPDARFRSPSDLTVLIRESVAAGFDVASPQILTDADGSIWFNGGSIDRRTWRTTHHGYGSPESSEVRAFETEFVSGCVMLISPRAISRLRGMRPDLFMYGEDVEFCLRAKSQGLKLGVVPSVVAVHVGGASSGGSYTPFSRYYEMRNRLIIRADWEPRGPIARFATATGAVLRELPSILKHANRARSTVSTLRGAYDGLRGSLNLPPADRERRVRVALLNNYPMREALRLVEDGAMPAQHLWGYWELRDEFDWLITGPDLKPSRRIEGWRQKASEYSRVLIGDIRAQREACRFVGRAGVIFAADQQSAVGIGWLNRTPFFNRKLIVQIHNGPRLGILSGWMMGADKLIFLSPQIRERTIAAFPKLADRSIVANWGPSLDSPVYRSRRNVNRHPTFVAAGKTNRDSGLLSEVIQSGRFGGIVFSDDGTLLYRDGELVSHQGVSSYQDILKSMAESAAVVVVLDDTSRISGLTEVADGRALGNWVLLAGADVVDPLLFSDPGVVEVAKDPGALSAALRSAITLGRAPGDIPSHLTMEAYSSILKSLVLEVGRSHARVGM